jgi:hypothetical protein
MLWEKTAVSEMNLIALVEKTAEQSLYVFRLVDPTPPKSGNRPEGSTDKA